MPWEKIQCERDRGDETGGVGWEDICNVLKRWSGWPQWRDGYEHNLEA